MDTNAELGQFLRSRRARLRPTDVGITAQRGAGRRIRRVEGLRREEVAHISGVSVDYYARLEQGRTGQVSSEILAAIARALRLDPTEQEYFFVLASGPTLGPFSTPEPTQQVRPSVTRLLRSITDMPALVMGHGMQLLAMNEMAAALYFDIEAEPVRDRNLARWTFLAPQARERYADWEAVASDAAAVLRAQVAGNRDDSFLNELIGELSVKSAEFRCLWSEHRVHTCTFDTQRFVHPIAGPLTLDYDALGVPGAPEQKLITYSATAGSQSAEALTMLASWIATPAARTNARTGSREIG
ncbi:MAG: helix-turn-helix protein [Nocardia sp.]|uniref:helix-turn-helix domain-containing protein n=1 Tax=Nocardia sp. TaxID=1821 RepID=UPI00260B99B9|nr:helix-turn-helix transcriptional regulator [Nocardia sp.]MCU1646101.1 helix-turn-helix protein [Nocardia sp.]